VERIVSLFDHTRLTNGDINLDLARLRRGDFTDRYFDNVVSVLMGAHFDHYRFAGHSPRPLPLDPHTVEIGDLIVEAQVFNRRAPFALVAGVDVALVMLRHAAGYVNGAGGFEETWRELKVEAVEDGALTQYAGDPEQVQPVIRIRGRYRDFALLETPILGVLSRATRIATAVYHVLQAAGGKPVLFFPARFDLPETQSADGYAYRLAVQRYNYESGKHLTPIVSTDAQAAWWGGSGGGTIPHALIAAFLADTAEATVAFARYLPTSIPRIALVDFNNDTVGDTLATISAFWPRYRDAFLAGDEEEQRRWTLSGVRLDTSGNVRDLSLGADDPKGVSPALVRRVREALDGAWESWDMPDELVDEARRYCHNVQIVVSGGFDAERIERFEREAVPVNAYGVGSTLLRNDHDNNTDYTLDVVRVKLGDEWVDMAKVGRKPGDNPDLSLVDLTAL
jgi:nicotinate phosphoribosyltransferase